MAISRKPANEAPPSQPAAQPDEQEVLSLINKGGSIPKPTAPKPAEGFAKPMLVQLRLYPDLVHEIDAARQASGKKRRPLSRHAWIVAAIEEKLAREQTGP